MSSSRYSPCTRYSTIGLDFLCSRLKCLLVNNRGEAKVDMVDAPFPNPAIDFIQASKSTNTARTGLPASYIAYFERFGAESSTISILPEAATQPTDVFMTRPASTMGGGTAWMTDRGANYTREICPVRSVGAGNQQILNHKGGTQEGATYRVVFGSDTCMEINLLHFKRRS